MISPIHFTGSVSKVKDSEDMPQKATKTIMVKQEKGDGFFKTGTNAIANTQKFLVDTKEGISGLLKAMGLGLGTGATVMGTDWILQKCLKKGVKEQSIFTTPIKTACNIVTGVIDKAVKVFSKDTSFRKVISYPFIGLPRDIYKYVSSAKGCSKIGKGIAITLGIGAFAFSAFGTILKINALNADIDHQFKVGHNS